MIKKPTVLILGAGASIPFGFPSGRQLMNEILKELNPSSISSLTRALLKFDMKLEHIDRFSRSLSRSGKSSVDAFLAHREEFMRIGKIAITLKLSQYEDEKKLFETDDKWNNWYEYLWNRLDAPFEDFDKHKLSIITFNYDRSFEHYMITTMRNLYDKNENECEAKLNKIPIIHVHGKLGSLWRQEKNGRIYEPGINYDHVESISEQIKVISEKIDTSEEFDRAQEIISAASKIYFLGFGYDNRNLQRLRIKDLGQKIPPNFRMGSGFEIKSAEKEDFNGKWGIRVDCEHGEILEFLRHNVIFN